MEKRIANEAFRAWDKYDISARALQGSVSLRVYRLQPEKRLVEQEEIEFKQREGCGIWLRQGKSLDGKTRKGGLLYAVNRQYGFELVRQRVEGRWAVKNTVFVKDGKTPDTFDEPRGIINLWCRFPIRLMWDEETQLPILFKHPKFSMGRVTSEVRDGRTLAKVEFAYAESSMSNERRRWLKGGWLLLDPDFSWVLRAYEIETMQWQGKGTQARTLKLVGSFEYQEGSDRLPLISGYVKKWVYTDSSEQEEYKYEISRGDVPETEFMLPAFGFSHPDGYKPPPLVPWYLWFIGGAVVSLGTGWYLFRRIKRRINASPPKPSTRGLRTAL